MRLAVTVLVGMSLCAPLAAQDGDALLDIEVFVRLLSQDDRAQSLKLIRDNWREEYAALLLETVTISDDPIFSRRLLSLLRKQTSERHGYDVKAWQRWLWNSEPRLHPDYADFKAVVYSFLDARFPAYFDSRYEPRIRLDEILWGGVQQDGIPPLRSPKMVSAADAAYLKDDNIVFGLAVDGDTRAYPKRILAWHEMFVDTVGGVPVAGVYCTLCGSMVLYETVHDGVEHQLGTSGFLYRSNKLMYDQATQSLWSTLRGEPVVGPLASSGIVLERGSVVTTTWGEWRRRHPDTKVLDIDTGYDRDYSEGFAYRDYFATDELMFEVPKRDDRLKNKDEVLALAFPKHTHETLAISADFLRRHRVYQDSLGDVGFVVLTDESGANRVYQAGEAELRSWSTEGAVVDRDGVEWTLYEDRLESANGRQLRRLPAHRAFWFGWYAAYPDTRLVH